MSDIWGDIATIGGGLVSSWLASEASSDAASSASNAQISSSNAAIAEQRSEFDTIQHDHALDVGLADPVHPECDCGLGHHGVQI